MARWGGPVVPTQPKPAAPAAPTAPGTPDIGSLLALYGGGPSAAPTVDYTGAFQGALDASRAGVERQFGMALNDINQREGLANQAIGQLPGQLTSIYQQGDANLMTGAKGLDDAQKASGLQSYMPAGAQMAPLAAARTNDRSARQADVPLLSLAVQTEMGRQRGAVNQARIGAQNDINQQLTSFYSGLAQAQASRSMSQGDDVRNLLLQHALGESDTAGERAYQDSVRKDEQNFQLRLKGDDESPEVQGLTKKQVAAVRKSQEYKDAVEAMKNTKKHHGGIHLGPIRLGGHDTGHGEMSPEDLYKKYRTNPKVLRVLVADFPEVAAYVAGIGQ